MGRNALLALLALLALAACATAGGGRPAAAGRPDLVVVSRALTRLEAAERLGDADEGVRFAQLAELAPEDVAQQFLAVSGQPPGERRWSAFHDLAGAFPRSALPHVGMARTYLAWRTWDQAEKAIAAALAREPDCWLAVRVRAELLEARGRLEEATADYRAVLAADPANPEAHLGLARIARARGDAEAAHAEAAAALEATRTLPGAYALLAGLALELGEPAAAIDFWKGAVDAAPRDRAARIELAKLLRAQGDAAGARDQWQAAVALQEDPDALTSLAEAARAAGDGAAEQRALERLAQVRPSAAEWRRIAEARMASNDSAGAERAYLRALEGAPRDPELNLGLGRVLLARGDSQEAVRALRNAGEPGAADLAAVSKRLNLERVSGPDVARLQRAVQALVDRTFRARSAEAPALSGSLRLRVTVDAAGAATLVEVMEDSVHDDDVRASAFWNLSDAGYPADGPGRYSFSFVFRRR
jgi:tetratricopeptide (TPR) repeat protein